MFIRNSKICLNDINAHLLNAEGKRESIIMFAFLLLIILYKSNRYNTFFVYLLIPLFNSSIWLLDRLLSVLDRTVNDDSEQEGECERCVLRCCRSQRRQNKSLSCRLECIGQTEKLIGWCRYLKNARYRPIYRIGEGCKGLYNVFNCKLYNAFTNPIPKKLGHCTNCE